jgi:hypothetical protein
MSVSTYETGNGKVIQLGNESQGNPPNKPYVILYNLIPKGRVYLLR